MSEDLPAAVEATVTVEIVVRLEHNGAGPKYDKLLLDTVQRLQDDGSFQHNLNASLEHSVNIYKLAEKVVGELDVDVEFFATDVLEHTLMRVNKVEPADDD
jgi:hypothetical protein